MSFRHQNVAGARDGKTLMTVIQSGLPTAELRDEHRAGVPVAFTRLEQAIQVSRRTRYPLDDGASEARSQA